MGDNNAYKERANKILMSNNLGSRIKSFEGKVVNISSTVIKIVKDEETFVGKIKATPRGLKEDSSI